MDRCIASAAFAILLPMFFSANPAFAGDDEYTDIHTIGVISALGNDVDMESYGVSNAFNTDYIVHTDWNLDAQVVDEISQVLAKRFTVKKIVVDPKAFLNLYASQAFGFMPDAASRVAALPETNDVDAYVVVVPRVKTAGGPAIASMLPWGLAGENTPGLFGDKTRFVPHYIVGVIDARTGATIDYSGKPPDGSILASSSRPYPDTCANELWADNADHLTTDQKAHIRRQLASALSRTIVYHLADANLIGAEDADADTVPIALPRDPLCHEP